MNRFFQRLFGTAYRSVRLQTGSQWLTRAYTVSTVPYTGKLTFEGANAPVRPAYQVMDLDGKLRKGAKKPEIDEDQLVKMYETMVRLQNADQVLYDLQRQGSISFYMTAFGEYAQHIGSAAALDFDDVVFAQYREAGVLLWRGFTIQDMVNQCYSNKHDSGKGRQMPVHYGSKALNFHTISSPLTTQLPHSVGAAYALKRAGKQNITITYFGEGAASEGDAHAAMNFAATLETPTIFFCRNNGFAISTPTKDQYRGDGISSRAPGYGMDAARVDGNDIFAVYEATKEARRIALEEKRPVMLECMSYRVGHHSTSDDSSRYRSADEIKQWQETNDPIVRLRRYLERAGLWDEQRDATLNAEARQAVMDAMTVAESTPRSSLDEMFSDVYDEKPALLREQERELHEHLELYPNDYPTKAHQ